MSHNTRSCSGSNWIRSIQSLPLAVAVSEKWQAWKPGDCGERKVRPLAWVPFYQAFSSLSMRQASLHIVESSLSVPRGRLSHLFAFFRATSLASLKDGRLDREISLRSLFPRRVRAPSLHNPSRQAACRSLWCCSPLRCAWCSPHYRFRGAFVRFYIQSMMLRAQYLQAWSRKLEDWVAGQTQPCLLMLDSGLIATFSVHGRPAAWKTELWASLEMAVPHHTIQRQATMRILGSSATSIGRAPSFCGLIEKAR